MEVSHSVGVPVEILAGWTAEFSAATEQRPIPRVDADATHEPAASANAAKGTSDAVMKAALREFAEKGFAGARVDAIAAAAGVNKTALYYHFGNKDELFAAALEFGYAEFHLNERRPNVGGTSVIAELERLFGAVFDGLHANRQHASLIADENRHGGKHLAPALRTRIHGLIEPVIHDLSGLIERGQREGVLRRHLDATRIYLSMISLSMFYLTHVTTLSVSVGLDLSQSEEVIRWREHVINFLIAAVRTSGPPA